MIYNVYWHTGAPISPPAGGDRLDANIVQNIQNAPSAPVDVQVQLSKETFGWEELVVQSEEGQIHTYQ